jgi:spore photoproduct lyase
MVTKRLRKSKFVRLFDKTPKDVVCPHFYELILSNGCPYNCSYCYLKLTFRGKSNPTLFLNDWTKVESELNQFQGGIFSTGELADSLAIIPPLLPHCLNYFESQKDQHLLLVTKSINIGILLGKPPSSKIITSFSINAANVAKKHERGAPDPAERLEAAHELRQKGWRVRIRLDPLILEEGLDNYKDICYRISRLHPEMVTVGSLRQYPGLFNYAPTAPRQGLVRSLDGRMRYQPDIRIKAYNQIADWLGSQPALCKETKSLWHSLGWKFYGCNCSLDGVHAHSTE